MAISSVLGSQALVPTGFGFRNSIINGCFDIWQRWVATSINVSSGATGYTADRWFMSPVGATMGAVRDTNVPPLSSSKYSLQIAPNGVGGSTCNLGQRIEASNVYSLKGTVTFSAWIFNNTTATITPVLLLGTPSAEDNFTTVTNYLTQSLQPCVNGQWTKVTYTGDISGYTNINNGLQVEIQTSGHTTFGRTVRIAEVQLEKNPQPTTIERRPIGVELALCQRYFQTITASLLMSYNPYWNVALGSGDQRINYSFKTTMRAIPTVLTTGNSNIHAFQYRSYNTGVTNYNLIADAGTVDVNGILSLGYVTTNNGGGTLAVGNTVGSNNNAMWVSAEL
jgi:hypothetical protein